MKNMSQVFEKEMEAEVVEGFRLSPQQQRLWELQQNSSAYRAHGLLNITGALSVELLKKSFRRLIDRQEILRTVYFHAPGLNDRLQVIQQDCDPLWMADDLSGMDAAQQATRIEELLQSEVRFQFNPAHCCVYGC
jgi:hypothetical protein